MHWQVVAYMGFMNILHEIYTNAIKSTAVQLNTHTHTQFNSMEHTRIQSNIHKYNEVVGNIFACSFRRKCWCPLGTKNANKELVKSFPWNNGRRRKVGQIMGQRCKNCPNTTKIMAEEILTYFVCSRKLKENLVRLKTTTNRKKNGEKMLQESENICSNNKRNTRKVKMQRNRMELTKVLWKILQ